MFEFKDDEIYKLTEEITRLRKQLEKAVKAMSDLIEAHDKQTPQVKTSIGFKMKLKSAREFLAEYRSGE